MPSQPREPQQSRSKWPTFVPFLAIITAAFVAIKYASPPQPLVTTSERKHLPTVNSQLDDLDQLIDPYGNHSHSLYRRLDPYKCTHSIPCHTEACCGSFGGTDVGTCGFGPTFCGSDCASQCDAKPECGQYADPPGKTCPLNVCCSQFGFCGTTSLFCDADQKCQSNCGTPAVPAGKSSEPVLNRVIGYYEAWSARRECYPFPPTAIPTEGLTHVNFAFAYVDPSSFAITTMDSQTPESLFTQTTDVRTLKSLGKDLQVFISIGGWTFNDNGTSTQDTFSTIASSESNRQKFADELIFFMKKYGFDGVDLDWEYPGAPDRGGKTEDTDNFVKLMQTLRNKFDASSHGPYGLSFTIPSSYWYLRWFDVPGMVEYADWVNLMSYDLHGIWDRENPIGNQVLAHTNLTEIKQAVDLLWRNDVAPGKVVLGLGFYGRAFQLSNSGCKAPGCEFAGAAKPGTCTNSAGTLAYFEIQDIIESDSPDIVHDNEAAVNYFAFDSDQWVSFDDEVTFKQKVDWADSVGLGGVMIWSIDQDDKQFSALTGLVGRNLDDYDELVRKSQVTDAGHWASINGQKCITTDCGNPAQCPAGYAMAPGGEGFPDDCGSKKYRIVCCPLDAMPDSCLWRGGESSVGRPSCHGQCHTGEVTLFHSRHATKNCLRPGFQAFCCTANSWARQIESCKYTGCGGKCGSGDTAGLVSVAYKQVSAGPGCYFHYTQELCCPPNLFNGCHWVGKGTCDDNECDDNDVQLDTDTFGSSPGSCAGNGRKKVLCCDAPKNTNPFLPVSLEKIFPTLPPTEDYTQFDLQLLGSDEPTQAITNLPNVQTFGLIVIVGPESSVQSLRRRDGSHLRVLDCDSIKRNGTSRIRFVCMDDGPQSNCRAIHEGGVEGTILAMPDRCGHGDYAVLHTVDEAQDRSLPYNLVRSAPWNPTIWEAEISYNFGLVKKDAGDIFVRIDYSNTYDYWNQIVQGDPQRRKTKRSPPEIHPRFFSSSHDAWKDKYNSLREGVSYGSLKKQNFDSLLVGEASEKCSGKSDDGFLKMSLTGSLNDAIEFGYTFVGTIAPNFNIEQAFGYFDSNLQLSATLEFDGKGYLSVPAGLENKQLWSSPVRAWGFTHPGILDFSPSANVFVSLYGEGDIDGKFSTSFIIGTDSAAHDTLPTDVGVDSGTVSNSIVQDAFDGDVSLPSSASKSRRMRKRQSFGDSILALRLFTRTDMDLNINFYHQNQPAAAVNFEHQLESYVRLSTTSSGTPKITFSNSHLQVEAQTVGTLPWGDDSSQHNVGDQGQALVLHEGSSTPAARDAPDINGYALFGGRDLMSCSNNRGGGGGSAVTDCICLSAIDQFDRSLDLDPDTGDEYMTKKKRSTWRDRRRWATRPSQLDQLDPSLAINPDTGRPYVEEEEELFKQLDERAITYGKEENYTVTAPSGSTWQITMPRYPNGQNGNSLMQLNPNAGRYDANDCYDCGDYTITSSSTNPDTRVVTEHIHERQTERNTQQYMMNGQARRGDGTLVRSSYPVVPENYLAPGGEFQTDYSTWDPAGPYTGRPIDRVNNAYGSGTNPGVLVNTESNLNSIKAREWVGSRPMSDELWDQNGFNQADSGRADGALTFLRSVIQVITYMNDDTINGNWANVVNTVHDEYQHFQDRILVVRGVQLRMAEMQTEFLRDIVIQNLEGVEDWLTRRINLMRAVWQPVVGTNPDAQAILDQLTDIEEFIATLYVDTTRFADI